MRLLLLLLTVAAVGCGVGEESPAEPTPAPPPSVPELPPRADTLHCAPHVDGEWVEDLAETGCYATLTPLVDAPDVVPYYVRSPLWTDGAAKLRGMALPPGTAIDTTDGWRWPEGAVLLKTFVLGEPVETRVMVRTEDGWTFASYRWEDGEALRTEGGFTEDVSGPDGSQPYQFPSMQGCAACHLNGVLGPVPEQLNGLWRYGEVEQNQLDALASLGIFDPAPVAEELASLQRPDDPAASLQERARAYLHANCSHCHRPGGWAPVDMHMDLRATTPLADARICDEPLQFTGPIDAGEFRLRPGQPEDSALWRRQDADGLGRMPPMGTELHDPRAAELVRGWIAGLEGCPGG